ncbi:MULTISPECIES: potassium-transporting ATPase subunit KdpC [Hyphomicrobium]|jgi:K+-transporting ATPase ATPase C chain|uniref:potassium-transporting ATPase subunit KdpC n=1 Tax=Hyphomicrobium TaxID=81 RepID=UPI000369F6E6|nr:MULTISPECIES: potassium-transporting ATPase subunit KdpC [Hyphomicrobium]WBT37043.1 potassium-transporting ATPase subunit KdpC [Hyphomicrobium sp. DMF-1]HML43137.1 potassium-transporting ATPase subunit KdpC [Hyphomicrobium zavarzinii]
MFTHLRPALVMVAALTVLTGVVYPLAITGLSQVLLPAQANGSLLTRDGAVVGSSLVGQLFTGDGYFHGRPSAAGSDGYDASASSGSNLGPTSAKLVARVEAAIPALAVPNGASVPADAVTASASGLDPHISPDYAALQVERVAKARGVPPARIREILAGAAEEPLAGVVGEPRVNVLLLNIALDAALASGTG